MGQQVKLRSSILSDEAKSPIVSPARHTHTSPTKSDGGRRKRNDRNEREYSENRQETLKRDEPARRDDSARRVSNDVNQEVEATFGINKANDNLADERIDSVKGKFAESETIALRLAEIEAETEDHIMKGKYSDVLLIVTGGTLCMV